MAKGTRIEIYGDNLAVVLDDGRKFLAYPVPGSLWLLSQQFETSDVTPDPGTPGDPGGTTPPTPGEWMWPFQYSRYVIQSDPKAQYGMRINPVTGQYRLHAGLDFGGGGISGLPIPAAAAGTVSGKGLDARGNYLNIDHGGNVTTCYFHMVSASPKNIGDVVAKGDTLGRVGSTGNSTGAHLHWETRISGNPKNPRDFMKERGVEES